MRKVRSKQPGIIMKHNNPYFEIRFDDTNPIEVEDEVAEILLKNDMIEEVGEELEKERKKRGSSFGKVKGE